MKRIAITQRVDSAENYEERRDALDQNWHTFLHEVDIIALPLPNTPASVQTIVSEIKFDGIILSGGNDLALYGGDAPERDETEKILLDHAIKQDIPLMGVCRGLQFIQVAFGATLHRVANHVAVNHKISFDTHADTVNSFHNFGTTEGVSALVTMAVAEDGVIEAVSHRDHRIHGIMWHPERESPFRPSDIKLFQDFFGA